MKPLIFTCSLLLCSLIVYCQTGSIDQSFGENGLAKTNVSKVQFGTSGKASALQQDGKILVGGGYYKAKLMRYLPNGAIDSSFGKNGVATVEEVDGTIAGIAIQQDGKIVAAGYRAIDTLTTNTLFAARFTKDGVPDASYGTGGFAFFDFNDYSDYNAVALQQDGKLLLTGGGTHNPEATLLSYGVIVRLTADGSLDKRFGDNGRVVNNDVNNSTCITVQSGEKILTGGAKYNPFTSEHTYVVNRYNEDGMPDNEFGVNGSTITNGFGYDAQPLSILVQPDGRVVVGGYSVLGIEEAYYMVALRYEANGVLDNTFGEEGKVVITFENRVSSRAYATLLQPDGKIVLAGGVYKDIALSGADYALCRINKDGSIDSSFAIDGRQVTALDNTVEEAQGALLQPDGKIILIGSSHNLKTDDFYNLLIRYNGDKEQKSIIARIKQFLHNHAISWQGLDNKNISYYSIQYSKSGKGFAEKGKLSGWGSSRLQDYNFTVADAGFYRIVAVDRKGYKTFSNKVLVSASDLASAASIYTNPVRDYVTVQGLPTNEKANITIANSSGTVLAKGVSNGSTQYRAPAASLQPGTYYLNITTAGKTETLKFVKE